VGAPGFEKLVEIPKPWHFGRIEIFRSLLSSSGLRLSSLPESTVEGNELNEADLLNRWCIRLANLTPGALPGDIVRLVQASIDLNIGTLHKDDGQRGILDWNCVLRSLAHFSPSQLRDLDLAEDLNSEKLSWDKFGGYSNIKVFLQRLLLRKNCSNLVNKDDKSKQDSLSSMQVEPRGLLITGESGCGKTFLARVIASEASMNYVYVKSSELLSPFLGQTEAKVRMLFKKARSAAPCVLFFDDFDVLACRRSLNNSSGGHASVNARVLSTFLNELDGIASHESLLTVGIENLGNSSTSNLNSSQTSDISHSSGDTLHASPKISSENNILVIAACADESVLDEALLRPGRLQYHVHLELPTCDDILSILEIRARAVPFDSNISLPDIAKTLFIHGASVADVNDLFNLAVMNTIRECIESTTSQFESYPLLTFKHFDSALCQKYQVYFIYK
jgi:transitional endoplasmic reticulum ATPase